MKYSVEKGYGFIRTEELTEDLFVHISEVKNAKTLTQGQQVTFEVKKNPKGLSAVSVIAGRKVLSPYLLYGEMALFITSVLTVLFMQKSHPLIAYFGAINLTTFILYGYDKMISRTQQVRIPETVLHGVALLGGSPAGLWGQRFFRHKTLKSSFQMIYLGIVIVQIALIVLVVR